MPASPTIAPASAHTGPPAYNKRGRAGGRSARDALAGRLFTLPVLLATLALVAYPIVYGMALSFFDTNLVNRWDFVGLENYARLAQDQSFYESIGITFAFAFLVVAGNLVVGTGLALLLNRGLRFTTFFRVVLILPWLFPEVVVALIWKWMYNPIYGLFNANLEALGIIDQPVAWLDDPNLALFAVAVAAIWKGYPLVMILVLAGLQTVPRELYEAASLDRASAARQFWHVTLPSIRPVLLAVIVLETAWWFKHFTIVWLLTNGGPAGATNVVSIDIYQRAFKSFQWGDAAATAVIVLLICLVLSGIYQKVLHRDDE
ncbi:carbohydrate ABC transporter permease [Microbacterium sp. AK031]|uniref:carbohydrate ABC transporter permease n=1 Tax=Microbacterium sp. AK031 TaxID=2723076 RepID=UPI002168D112|nr:sugar ABC transporter permease [Microbacterium sp. AK031]MCS3844129.1 ABC-type sugar transport system permease subunit [Microbacterium sp. AK031]